MRDPTAAIATNDALSHIAEALREQTKQAATWHRESQEAADRRHAETLAYWREVEAAKHDETIAMLRQRIDTLTTLMEQANTLLSRAGIGLVEEV